MRLRRVALLLVVLLFLVLLLCVRQGIAMPVEAEAQLETKNPSTDVSCPDCEASIPVEADFCPPCGESVVAAPEDDRH